MAKTGFDSSRFCYKIIEYLNYFAMHNFEGHSSAGPENEPVVDAYSEYRLKMGMTPERMSPEQQAEKEDGIKRFQTLSEQETEKMSDEDLGFLIDFFKTEIAAIAKAIHKTRDEIMGNVSAGLGRSPAVKAMADRNDRLRETYINPYQEKLDALRKELERRR